MTNIETLQAPRPQEKKRRMPNVGHAIAHFVSEHVSTPLINISQYRMFENPSIHKKSIDREMHRTFQKAGSSIGKDFASTGFFFAQSTLGVAGEHIAYPLALIPLLGPHLPHYIPLPFDLHAHFNLPLATSGLADLYNKLPFPDVPKRVDYDGNKWPLLTSMIITAGLANIPNSIRAFSEKRPVKRIWYPISTLLAPTHIPLLFNSQWAELATKLPQTKARNVFAEKVCHVLSNEPITEGSQALHQPSRFDIVNAYRELTNKIPPVRALRRMATGDIHIDPGDREIFATAIENRLHGRRTRAWWEKRLAYNAHRAVHDKHFGLTHQAEKMRAHERALDKMPLFPGKIFHKTWLAFHKYAHERAEEKIEAIQTAQNFLSLTKN